MRNIRLTTIAKEILMINEDLPLNIPYEYDFNDMSIKMFEQTWGNTSGGFEGMGGSAMTTQMTYVIYNCLLRCFHVFFGGRLAYSLEDGEYDRDKFLEDLKNESIKGVEGSKDYKINK